jgi:membrane protein
VDTGGFRDVAPRFEASFPGRCLRTFLEMQGVDRAMALASQAFTALIPLLILVSAVMPASRQDLVAEALSRRFGLTGDAASSMEALFAHSGSGAIGGLSVLILVFSGVSLTRRLQRMYLQAWRLEGVPGLRGSLNAALGLAVLVVEMALLYLIRSWVRGLPLDEALALTVSALAGVALWTSIPWLLLDRRIPWRRLLVGGLLSSGAVSIYGEVSALYMPRQIESYSERYGMFGVTLALVGWLLAVMIILVTATVIAAELDRSEARWFRWLRLRLGLGDPTSLGRDDVAARRAGP